MRKTKVNCMWEQRLMDFNSSGQTLLVGCNENNVKPARMHYWIREIKANDIIIEKETNWVTVSDTTDSNVITKEKNWVVKIGSASIEISSGFDIELFSKVTKVLSGVSVVMEQKITT